MAKHDYSGIGEFLIRSAKGEAVELPKPAERPTYEQRLTKTEETVGTLDTAMKWAAPAVRDLFRQTAGMQGDLDTALEMANTNYDATASLRGRVRDLALKLERMETLLENALDANDTQ